MQVARKPVARLSLRRVVRALVMIVVVGVWPAADGRAAKISRHNDEVYLVRGLADVFSLGLNQLGERLRAKGVDVTVVNHTGWRGIVRRIVEDRKRYGARPVVLVGHSLGGNAVIWIAKALGEHRIKVSYMATLAAPAPGPVPPNVRRVTNYYFSFGIGAKLVAEEGFHGALENKDLSGMRGVTHFNVDDQKAIQAEIAGRVLRVVR